MATKTTPLQKIQKQIDRCNQKSGCNRHCSKRDQEQCRLLKEHRARMESCRESGLPVQYW